MAWYQELPPAVLFALNLRFGKKVYLARAKGEALINILITKK